MSDASSKRKIVWAAVVLALVAAIAVGGRLWGAGTAGENDVSESAPPSPGRLVDFACVDAASGKQMRTSDLAGRIVVADFMFTSCQATCPRLAAEMKKVQTALADADDVRLVSFSVDPDRDSVTALAKYADAHGATPGRWIYLRSETDDLKKLMCGELHLADANEPMLHSDRLVLFDAEGAARGFYRPLDGVEPDWQARLVGDVAKLRTSAH